MTDRSMFEGATITRGVGLDSYVVLGGVAMPVTSAEGLREDAAHGLTVQGSATGTVVARLAMDGGWFELRRLDAEGAASTHRLDASSTDADRLASHWQGFCEAALRDHGRRTAPVAGHA